MTIPRASLGDFRRWVSGQKLLAVLSVVVGLIAGLAAFLYINLVHLVHVWIDLSVTTANATVKTAVLVLAPAVGGLLAGALALRLARGQKGTATASIIYALRRQGAVIPWNLTLSRALASALTIGSGGSAGPEGPAVGIGAGIGSLVGRAVQLPRELLQTLVVAGAAAGIAAVFNAPIAAVMYALEVLVREFASEAFAMVVLATVTASVTSYLLLGHRIFLTVPAYSLNHPLELAFYLFLGVAAAFVANAFTKLFIWTESTFNASMRVPVLARPALGGLIVGMIGLLLPQVMGDGHSAVSALIAPETSLPLAGAVLLAMLAGKMVATSATLGSGGSGGLFVPTLCMGAILGTIAGRVVHPFFPEVSPTGAYALVGMGAFFAAFTHAPFTSVMLLFEITNDYHIILPLLFAVGIATMTSRWLDPESLDSQELRHRGLRLHDRAELAALERFTVGEVMASPVETVPEKLPLSALTDFIARHRHTGYPVLNDAGEVVGLITYSELHDAYSSRELPPEAIVAQDLMRRDFATAVPSDSLTQALACLQRQHTDRILVMDPAAPRKVIGIITKGDILGTYRKLLSDIE